MKWQNAGDHPWQKTNMGEIIEAGPISKRKSQARGELARPQPPNNVWFPCTDGKAKKLGNNYQILCWP